jgi:hypothetical protein
MMSLPSSLATHTVSALMPLPPKLGLPAPRTTVTGRHPDEQASSREQHWAADRRGIHSHHELAIHGCHPGGRPRVAGAGSKIASRRSAMAWSSHRWHGRSRQPWVTANQAQRRLEAEADGGQLVDHDVVEALAIRSRSPVSPWISSAAPAAAAAGAHALLAGGPRVAASGAHTVLASRPMRRTASSAAPGVLPAQLPHTDAQKAHIARRCGRCSSHESSHGTPAGPGGSVTVSDGERAPSDGERAPSRLTCIGR